MYVTKYGKYGNHCRNAAIIVSFPRLDIPPKRTHSEELCLSTPGPHLFPNEKNKSEN